MTKIFTPSKLFIISFLLLVVFLFGFGVKSVEAQSVFDIWRDTGTGGATCNVEGPCTLCDAFTVLGNIIDVLMVLIIPVAILMIILGAMRIFTAGGSEDAFGKGKEMVKNAIIGVAIALASWVIINEVIHVLSGRIDFPWSQVQCTDETITIRRTGDLPGSDRSEGSGDNFENNGGAGGSF